MKTNNVLQKWMVQLSLWKVIVQVFECTRNAECTGPPVPPAMYSEPTVHKSPVMNSCKEKHIIPLAESPVNGDNDNETIHNNQFLGRRQ